MAHADLIRYLDFGTPADYRKLDIGAPRREAGGFLRADRESLAELACAAFSEIAFRMSAHHAEGLAEILADPAASEADHYVAASLVRNAAIAAEGLFPICQDTGTALVYGWKGETFITSASTSFDTLTPADRYGDDAAALAAGAARAYAERRLRNSQLGPTSMLAERNTRDNLPAAVDLRAMPGDAFRFVFAAKGGGSTGRTSLTMEAPAILTEEGLRAVLSARIKALGASGCPPYTIAAVLGGGTPSQALYAMELAALGLLDRVPAEADGSGQALRSAEWEAVMMKAAAATGIGAQWGGSRLALETRALRLPRHAAALPLAVGVSCSAHRRARAYADASGWYLERMEADPGRLLPARLPALEGAVRIDLDADPRGAMERLRSLGAGTRVLLSGSVAVARDAAHARVAALLRGGAPLPDSIAGKPIFYAGPTEAAPGQATGSFGPTTAGRMDSYLDRFMESGFSFVTIAKGGRSETARAAIARHRGCYLAAIGGAAALAARDHVRASRIVDFEDLGMEAIRSVTLRELPLIVVIDSGGADLYAR